MSADPRSGATLRYGVVCVGSFLAKWQRACIEVLNDVDGVTLAGVVVADAPPAQARPFLSRWHPLRRGTGLFELYDDLWVRRRTRADRMIDCTDLFRDVPAVEAGTPSPGAAEGVQPPEAVLAALDLDFLLCFADVSLPAAVVGATRFGVWSFRLDIPLTNDESARAWTSRVWLCRTTEGGGRSTPMVGARFAAVRHSYSQSRDAVLSGASGLAARAARGILEGSASSTSPAMADVGSARPPDNRRTARFLLDQAARFVGTQAQAMFVTDRWTVGILGTLPEPPLDDRSIHPAWVPELVEHGYLADPFPVTSDRQHAILVEEYSDRTRCGVISALVEDADGRWRLEHAVIDPGVHASYPFVVRDGDELYCVPETSRLGRAELWQCVDFPLRWDRVGTLIDDVPVIDPTVFRHEGRWWLLGGRADDNGDARMFAWWSESLTGPWSPHRLNPVKTDVTGARPGGTPFVYEGRLLRPAQDCSRSYGSALAVFEVVGLDERTFEEVLHTRLSPPPGRYDRGFHTLSCDGDFWVVDAKRRVVSPWNASARMSRRLRNLGVTRGRS